MKSNIYKIKVDTRDKLLAPILDAAVHVEIAKTDCDEQHAIFICELQNAWRLTVGFSDFVVKCTKFVISV
jgi:hypothetical protein